MYLFPIFHPLELKTNQLDQMIAGRSGGYLYPAARRESLNSSRRRTAFFLSGYQQVCMVKGRFVNWIFPQMGGLISYKEGRGWSGCLVDERLPCRSKSGFRRWAMIDESSELRVLASLWMAVAAWGLADARRRH